MDELAIEKKNIWKSNKERERDRSEKANIKIQYKKSLSNKRK
jgi:hypothetical protein